MKFKFAIAQFPGGGTTRYETTEWVTHAYHWLKNNEHIDSVELKYYNDTPITMSRNKCVKDALASGVDYLLMIDSDMEPDLRGPGARPFLRSSWDFLMRRRQREIGESLMPATIAAPYCGPPPIENIFVFKWENFESNDTNFKYHLVQFNREEAFRRAGIEEVAALPTGLIIYDMRLFPHLPKPWYAYEWSDEECSEKGSTEDVFQTRNASLLGFPQFINWDSWAIHIKTKHVVKPSPVCVEDISEQMHEALLNKRSRFIKVKIVGEDIEGERPWALAPQNGHVDLDRVADHVDECVTEAPDAN